MLVMKFVFSTLVGKKDFNRLETAQETVYTMLLNQGYEIDGI
jgi:hypothetical protein